jgi:hypothetical protein
MRRLSRGARTVTRCRQCQRRTAAHNYVRVVLYKAVQAGWISLFTGDPPASTARYWFTVTHGFRCGDDERAVWREGEERLWRRRGGDFGCVVIQISHGLTQKKRPKNLAHGRRFLFWYTPSAPSAPSGQPSSEVRHQVVGRVSGWVGGHRNVSRVYNPPGVGRAVPLDGQTRKLIRSYICRY